jgi:hypothetical protein
MAIARSGPIPSAADPSKLVILADATCYKRKTAIPTRMITTKATAYFMRRVNPIHVRRCRSSSRSIAVITTSHAE